MSAAIDEEVAVLGAVLQDPAALKEASGILLERDFYKEEHRLIWRAITELETEGKSIDVLSVVSKLKQHRCLTKVGGAAYLSSLSDYLPDVANVSYYAELVKKSYVDRELNKIGRKLQHKGMPPEQKMDIAFGALSELNRDSAITKESKVGVVSADVMSKIVEGNGFHEGVKIGFPALDEPLNGLNREHYIILAARPGVGKSAFSLQVAANVAAKGNNVLFISPEMSEKQLTMRLLSLRSGVNHEHIVKPQNLEPGEVDSLRAAHEGIRTLPLTIDDSSEQTITQVRLKARRIQATSGLDLLMIDYLQLLCEGDDSKEKVTMVSRGLKAIAKDLCVPVWACSQLRRAYGDEVHKRPDKSQLRGSGQLEQDADAILLMWHPSQKDKSKVEVIIDKNRHGRLGQTTLHFEKKTTAFSERDSGW